MLRPVYRGALGNIPLNRRPCFTFANFPLSRRQAIGAITAGGTALLPFPLGAQLNPNVVEPEAFGRFADGEGDAAPAINAAIAQLVRTGGGTVRFTPGKTYLLDATIDDTALTDESLRSSIAIPAGARNITFDLNNAILRQLSDARTFGMAFRQFRDRKIADTAIPLAMRARRGDSSVRLQSRAALPPGAVVMLVAGNTARHGYSPIAEMSIVSRVEGNTVWLDRPLRKDYREYRNWPYGLIDASSICAWNIALVGPGRVINTRRWAGSLTQVLGLRMQGVTCEGRGGMGLRGRDIAVVDCFANIEADWSKPTYPPCCLAFDTGTSDVTVRNFRASGGSNMTFLHLQEALANVSVQGLSIVNGTRMEPEGEWVGAISILGASWNITIDGAHVVNNPQGPAIEAMQSELVGLGDNGLILRNMVVEGQFLQPPVIIFDDDAVQVEGLDIRKAHSRPGRPLTWIKGNAKLTDVLRPAGM